MQDTPITSVACGAFHSVAVSRTCFYEAQFLCCLVFLVLIYAIESGNMYTWGGGKLGALGHGTTENEREPRRVDALEGKSIGHVSCGFWQTLVVTYQTA